jgi:AmiR/NasT family two-component response regulator
VNSLRVVIAEDDSQVAQNLREYLEAIGHEVVAEARDGAEAVTLVTTLHPDLVLMDIHMPRMDGLKASMAIMESQPTPIVLITAFSDGELVQQADEAGVLAYLVKPVNEAELRPAITLAVSRFRQWRALSDEAESLRQSLAERKVVERAKGILMQRLNITEEEAYLRLRQQARSRRVKMADLAQSIIDAVKLMDQSSQIT